MGTSTRAGEGDIRRVNAENFKALLDTGHVNIFSKVSIEQWVETLANHLAYVHLNDNHGDLDNNLVPREGNIKWDKFFDALNRYGLKPRYALRLTLTEIGQSLRTPRGQYAISRK